MQDLFFSKAYIEEHINTLKILFEDEEDIQINNTTYQNDMCASVTISIPENIPYRGDKKLILFLPNSLIQGEEMFIHYTLILDEEYASHKVSEQTFSKLSDVVVYILTNYYYN